MTDSPADVEGNDPQAVQPKGSRSEQRIHQLVAQRNEAMDELTQVRTELDKWQAGDLDDDTKSAIADLIRQTVQEQVAPLQKQLAAADLALSKGYTKPQAEAIRAVQDQYADIAPDEAELLVRRRQPELFPQQKQQTSSRQQSVPGILPASGGGPRSQATLGDIKKTARNAGSSTERQSKIQEGLRMQLARFFSQE
jgi:hypothetical protein